MSMPLIPRPQHLELVNPHDLPLSELAATAPLITSYDLEAIAAAIVDWAPGAAARLELYAGELALVENDIEYVDGDDWDTDEDLTDFAMTAAWKEHLAPEAFNLLVTPEELVLEAGDANGALYAVNALIQALRAPQLLPFEATSEPRYPVRGLHLDIARHFFGVPDIKRVIDIASAYNLNRLHLHLSDDQGWRIEIDGRPELTKKASENDVDGGKGGYLNFDDYEEIQQYAALFGMEIVPEIDLPGHTNALLVAFAEASPDGLAREPYAGTDVGFSWVHLTSDFTWQLLDDIIGSLARRTRSDYLHIGGDEVLKVDRPEYETFMARLGELVRKHGKKVAAWHEAAGAALPQDTQLQFWTSQYNAENLTRATTDNTVQFIASPAPHTYLDLKPTPDFPLGLTWAGLLDLTAAFDWDPSTELPVPAQHIVGVEACLWTETIRTFNDITTMLLPRLTGVASVAWGSPRIFDDYAAALPAHAHAWRAAGYAYYEAPEVDWI